MLFEVTKLAYSLPLVGVIWWGSLSDSLWASYLDTEFVDNVPGNGGRNSSALPPNTEAGCRGDEVLEDGGAATLASLGAPA